MRCERRRRQKRGRRKIEGGENESNVSICSVLFWSGIDFYHLLQFLPIIIISVIRYVLKNKLFVIQKYTSAYVNKHKHMKPIDEDRHGAVTSIRFDRPSDRTNGHVGLVERRS